MQGESCVRGAGVQVLHCMSRQRLLLAHREMHGEVVHELKPSAWQVRAAQKR